MIAVVQNYHNELVKALRKTKKTKENEYLSALNNSVSQLTNLFTKEIDDYEECLISEAEVFNRLHKKRESKKLNLLN